MDLAVDRGFPWSSGSAPAGAGTLRIAARRAVLAQWPRPLRPIAAVAMILGWPASSLAEAIRSSAFLSASMKRHRGRWRLVWWAWMQALAASVPPVEAFAFRLFDPGAAHRDAWLYTPEMLALLRRLNDDSAVALSADKEAFARWCSTRQLRCIPTLAAVNGADGEHRIAGGLPLRDLLVKPRKGAQGEGIEAWRWRDGHFQQNQRQLTPADLAATIVQRAAGTPGGLLVQPLLAPHPALQQIAGDGMPAVRVITGRYPDGRVVFGPATLQAPQPGAVISQSGPFRPVDVDSGQVLADAARLSAPVFDMPTAGDFAGITLPDWDRARASLLQAHAAFPGRAPLIGWDLLFDAQGVILCEANLGLSFYSFQLGMPDPLGRSQIGRVLEAWL